MGIEVEIISLLEKISLDIKITNEKYGDMMQSLINKNEE
jgi:hypothetical protein